MASTATEKKRYTYQDYLKTPDDKRYQLIEGNMFMTPAPKVKHQRISRELEFELLKFVKANDLGEVFNAPCDVYLDDENVVQPDIFFVSKAMSSIIGEKNIQGAPDLVIEIISESSAYRDFVQKKKLYARFGVKEYWIVTPEQESIDIYILKNKAYLLFKTCNLDDKFESPCLKGLKMELKSIF